MSQQKLYPTKHFLFSKTSSRRLEDVFSVTLFVFQDVFKTSSRRFQDVFKTSWKTKKCYTEDVFKTSSRHLQYVFTKTNVCWDRLRLLLCLTWFLPTILFHHAFLSFSKLFILFNFLISTVISETFNPAAELTIPIGTLTIKAKADI